MIEKNIIGLYNQLDQATSTVQNLLDQGMEMEDIAVVGSVETLKKLQTPFNVIAYIPETQLSPQTKDKQNFVGQIKDFFSLDSSPETDHKAYSAYEEELMSGAILLVTDRQLDEQYNLVDPAGLGPNEIDDYSQTFRLHTERLHVSRSIRPRQRIHIEKKVIEETRLIEVPVLKEELHVSKIDLDENGLDIPNAIETTVYPLSQEEIQIFSENRATDEVQLNKKVYKDIESIRETVRSEELIMDEDGHPKGLHSDQPAQEHHDPEKS